MSSIGAGGVYNGKFYLISGEINSHQATAGVYEYNPVTDTYTTKTAGTTTRLIPAYITYGSKVYLFGGNLDDGGASLYSIQSYDMASDTWADHGTFPIKAEAATIGQFGNKLYIFNFVSAGTTEEKTRVYSFDPTTNTLTLTPFRLSESNLRGGDNYGMSNGKFYAIGGYSTTGTRLSTIDEIIFP